MTTDETRITRAIQTAQAMDSEIDPATARLIASQWHGGGGSLMYAFASTGKLAASATETWREVADCYTTASNSDRLALDYLGTFFLNCADHHGNPESE